MNADSVLTITHIEEIDFSGEDTTHIYKVVIQTIFGKYFVTVYMMRDNAYEFDVKSLTVLETFDKDEAEREFKYRCALYRGEV